MNTTTRRTATSTSPAATTKPFAEVVRQAEESGRPDVLVSQANLRAARDLVPETEKAVERAEDELGAIEASWRRLEDSHEPMDHAIATATLTRANERQRGAKSWLDRCQRSAWTTDTSLADALTPTVEAAMPGVTVVATFMDPAKLPLPRAAELPVVLLHHLEGKPAEIDPDGYAAGVVSLTYYAGVIHRGLDGQAIEESAGSLGQDVEMKGMPVSRSRGVEVARFQVRVPEAMPYLPEVHPFNLRRLPSGFASAIAEEFNYRGAAITADFASMSFANARVTVMAGPKVEHEQTVDGETGERTLTLRGSVLVELADNFRAEDLPAAVEKVAGNFEGVLIGGVGVLRDFQLVPVGDSPVSLSEIQLGRELAKAPSVSIRDTSVVEFESFLQWTFEATLVSTTRRAAPDNDAA